MEFRYLITNHFSSSHYVPPHTHNCYELVYYYSAEGVSRYSEASVPAEWIDFSRTLARNASAIDFSQRTFVIFPPGVSHDEQVEKETRVLTFGFTLSEKEAPLLAELCLRAIADDYGLEDMLNALASEYYHPKPFSKLMLNTLVTQLFIKLARLTPVHTKAPTNFSYVRLYLDEYFMTDVNLDKLATQFGYSKSHFCALFKTKYGVSLKQYVLQKRLDYAKKELAETSIPVVSIASNAGFSDYYQFSAFFKKRTGLSPRAFREQAQTDHTEGACYK